MVLYCRKVNYIVVNQTLVGSFQGDILKLKSSIWVSCVWEFRFIQIMSLYRKEIILVLLGFIVVLSYLLDELVQDVVQSFMCYKDNEVLESEEV